MTTKVSIHSHQRSGTHYLGALINENFFGEEDYRFLFTPKVHCILESLDPDTKYLYITRNQADVLKSVFTMRGRFGLDVDTFKKFEETEYSNMYNPGKSVINVDIITRQFTENMVSGFFSCVGMKPMDYWTLHMQKWHELGHEENLLIVRYEDLAISKEEFNMTLEWIGEFLQKEPLHKPYKDIEKKVGYYV